MSLCDSCNGACCRWLIFAYSAADVDFLKARGGRVVMVGKRPFFAYPHTCPQLAGGRCSIYKTRPAACSWWKEGGEGCLACRELEVFKTE